MRPRKGVLECLHCSDNAKARTVVAKGRRIALASGQSNLFGGGRTAQTATTTGVDPPLQPKAPAWKPSTSGGTPHPQLGLFPFDEIRPGQKRFARDVTMAVTRRQHLVAEAPTGIGKTAASIAPALADAIEKDRTVLFLTGRQSQHHIAVDTLRTIRDRRGARFTLVDLVSKRDMCLRTEAQDMFPGRFPDFCAAETRTKSCQYLGDVGHDVLDRVEQGVLHVEELMAVSKEHGLCPHLVAVAASQHAHIVVADYNHIFSDIRERSLEKLGIDLPNTTLIVDEAHNLPDRIRQNHAHRISPQLLDSVQAEAKLHKARDIVADVSALKQAMQDLADVAIQEGRAEKSRLDDAEHQLARLEIDDLHGAFEKRRGGLGLVRTLEDVLDDLSPLVAQVKKGTDAQVASEALQRALEDWGRFRAGALRYIEWDEDITLHVRLLDPASAARTVFSQVHSSILMSGSLRPPELLRDVLGLDEERTAVKRYPSPFPPENKLVTIVQGTSTRFQDRSDDQWLNMARHVGDVSAAVQGNLALFAPSYAILRELRPFLRDHVHKEIIEEDPDMSKSERDQVLDALRGAKPRGGALLVGVLGGSFSEGVDFNDNLLSAVCIVGLPLAPPDLQVEATIQHYDRQFPGKGRLYAYTVPAMNKALQAMGRGVRGKDDKCIIMLLDQRYAAPPYRGFLPDSPKPIATAEPRQMVEAFAAAHGI